MSRVGTARPALLAAVLAISAACVPALPTAEVTLGGAERSSGSTPDVAAQRGEPEPRGRSTVRDAAAVDRAAGAAVDLALSIDDGLGRTARVGERIEVSEENVPQQMLHRDDAEVDIGQTRVIYPGIPGRVQRTFWIREEYGAEVERRLVQETVLEAAVPGVIGHGTRPLTLETPEGVVRYTRTLAVKATYYTPANGGKAPGDPWYGITATGARATRGIIAVDPRVIPMYSWVYVPGYGIAQARDVGSAIIGNHIDVCFDDGDGAWWGTRYLTVYLLVR